MQVNGSVLAVLCMLFSYFLQLRLGVALVEQASTGLPDHGHEAGISELPEGREWVRTYGYVRKYSGRYVRITSNVEYVQAVKACIHITYTHE